MTAMELNPIIIFSFLWTATVPHSHYFSDLITNFSPHLSTLQPQSLLFLNPFKHAFSSDLSTGNTACNTLPQIFAHYFPDFFTNLCSSVSFVVRLLAGSPSFFPDGPLSHMATGFPQNKGFQEITTQELQCLL